MEANAYKSSENQSRGSYIRSMDGVVKKEIGSGLLEKMRNISLENPSITKKNLCASMNISAYKLNDILKHSGNADMIRPRKPLTPEQKKVQAEKRKMRKMEKLKADAQTIAEKVVEEEIKATLKERALAEARHRAQISLDMPDVTRSKSKSRAVKGGDSGDADDGENVVNRGLGKGMNSLINRPN